MLRTVAVVLLLSSAALARDNGQWAQSAPAVRDWFNGLGSKNGPCCSFADGVSIDDPDWKIMPDGNYQVYYKSLWRDVPPEAVVHSATRIGYAVLWPFEDSRGTMIRCFMAGAEG